MMDYRIEFQVHDAATACGARRSFKREDFDWRENRLGSRENPKASSSAWCRNGLSGPGSLAESLSP